MVLVDGQGFRERAQERTAAAHDRVRRVVAAAAQDDVQLQARRAAAAARLRAAMRDPLAPERPASPEHPVNMVPNPPRRSPRDADDLPDSWLR